MATLGQGVDAIERRSLGVSQQPVPVQLQSSKRCTLCPAWVPSDSRLAWHQDQQIKISVKRWQQLKHPYRAQSSRRCLLSHNGHNAGVQPWQDSPHTFPNLQLFFIVNPPRVA
ncbi:unnamed protein product [Symbiodinium sp. CCMP2592]|nr:unnamed protein product [Symbiodinium sp. CCMP2592]